MRIPEQKNTHRCLTTKGAIVESKLHWKKNNYTLYGTDVAL